MKVEPISLKSALDTLNGKSDQKVRKVLEEDISLAIYKALGPSFLSILDYAETKKESGIIAEPVIELKIKLIAKQPLKDLKDFL